MCLVLWDQGHPSAQVTSFAESTQVWHYALLTAVGLLKHGSKAEAVEVIYWIITGPPQRGVLRRTQAAGVTDCAQKGRCHLVFRCRLGLSWTHPLQQLRPAPMLHGGHALRHETRAMQDCPTSCPC